MKCVKMFIQGNINNFKCFDYYKEQFKDRPVKVLTASSVYLNSIFISPSNFSCLLV